MRTFVALFCGVLLTVAAVGLIQAGRAATAPAPAAPGCDCPCGPGCDCGPCVCPQAGPRAEWWPGKLLWRTVSYPFRRHAPRRPIAPNLWRSHPECRG